MRRNKAFHEVRQGRVKATIWYETVDGKAKVNIAFTRVFNNDEKWWDGACFEKEDMPILGTLAFDVHEWLYQQSREQNEGGGDGEAS
jgi:hypothetical protein